MSGERIGHEPNNESWQPPQIEAAPSFGPPQATGEKKNNKNKKKNRNPFAGDAESVDSRRKTAGDEGADTPRPKIPLEIIPPSSLFEEKPATATAPMILGEKAFAAATGQEDGAKSGSGGDTIWQRDKNTSEALQANPLTGAEKAVHVPLQPTESQAAAIPNVERAVTASPAGAENAAEAPKPVQQDNTVEMPKTDADREADIAPDVVVDAHIPEAANEAQILQADNGQPEAAGPTETAEFAEPAEPVEPARLIRGEPISYDVQEMQQQMAADEAPVEDNPEPDSHAEAQPADDPPPLPPDPMAFANTLHGNTWNQAPDPTQTPQGGGNGPMPPTFDYDRVYGDDNEDSQGVAPIGTTAAGMAAAAHDVYESSIPPGLQRHAAESRRNALLAFGAGFMFGRHGKNKAVRRERKGVAQTLAQADKAVKQAELAAMTAEKRAANRYPAPKPEAAPLHVTLPFEATPDEPADSKPRTVYIEKAATVTGTMRAGERKSPLVDASPTVKTAKATESLVAPVAAAAAVAAFEKARPRREAEPVAIPRAAKAAAARAAERVVMASPEMAPELPRAVTGARSERSLGKRELLKVAKDIKVDGVSIKEVFKAKRIDEEGMREVVETYLKGGDIRQTLAKEVAIQEQSLELDPRIRQQHRIAERAKEQHPQSGGRERMSRVGSQAGVMLGHAKDIAVGGGGKVASASSKAAHKASKVAAKSAKTVQHDLIDNSNTNDWLSITAVVIVYAVILFLLFG